MTHEKYAFSNYGLDAFKSLLEQTFDLHFDQRENVAGLYYKAKHLSERWILMRNLDVELGVKLSNVPEIADLVLEVGFTDRGAAVEAKLRAITGQKCLLRRIEA